MNRSPSRTTQERPRRRQAYATNLRSFLSRPRLGKLPLHFVGYRTDRAREAVLNYRGLAAARGTMDRLNLCIRLSLVWLGLLTGALAYVLLV